MSAGQRFAPRMLAVAGAMALSMSMIMGSCGAAADLAVRADRSALLSMRVDVPAAVEARIRQFASSGTAAAGRTASAAPLFNAEAVAASVRARGITVVESAASGPRSYRGVFRVADLDALLAGDRKLAEALEYRHGAGWASLRLSLRRGNAAAIAGLFPGMDPDLLEALQPPALYDNPVTVRRIPVDAGRVARHGSGSGHRWAGHRDGDADTGPDSGVFGCYPVALGPDARRILGARPRCPRPGESG